MRYTQLSGKLLNINLKILSWNDFFFKYCISNKIYFFIWFCSTFIVCQVCTFSQFYGNHLIGKINSEWGAHSLYPCTCHGLLTIVSYGKEKSKAAVKK